MSDRIASALNRTWPATAVVTLVLAGVSCLPVDWLWWIA